MFSRRLRMPIRTSRLLRRRCRWYLCLWLGLLALLIAAPGRLGSAEASSPTTASARGASPAVDPPPDTAFARAQAQKRAQRETVLAACRRDLDTARQKGIAELEKVLAWAAENNLAVEARDLYDTLRQVYPDHAFPADLDRTYRPGGAARATQMPAPGAPAPAADTKLTADLQRRRDNALQAYGSYLMGPARACFSVRMFDRTFDILLEILRVAPDDRNARNYLGYAPVINPDTRAREWVLVTDAEHLNRREVWVAEVGWIPRPQLERVKQGEFCDNGRWSSLADANRRHADAADPWIIASPHFTLRTTLDRAAAIRLSVALEAYYRMVYKDFLGFFAPDGGALNLLFDTRAAARPLVVNYFATQAQYETFIRSKVSDPAHAKLLLASQGFYSASLGESVFYLGQTPEQNLRIAFHETTHQILGEYCRDRRGGHRLAWMSEMPAVYMERVRIQDGQALALAWTQGARHRSFDLDAKPMAYADFTHLTDEQFHAEEGDARARHYAVAGGLADFLMNAEGGIYRQGYMEFLRACYCEQSPAALDEYLGLAPAALEKRWSNYQKDTFTGASKGLRRVTLPRPAAAPAPNPFFAPPVLLVTDLPAACTPEDETATLPVAALELPPPRTATPHGD